MMPSKCELCNNLAAYCDSVPDSSGAAHHSNAECAYRLKPLCWLHAVEAKEHATARIRQVLTYEDKAYVYIGRASGDCVCEVCKQPYHRHPLFQLAGYDGKPYLTQLCSGEVCKL